MVQSVKIPHTPFDTTKLPCLCGVEQHARTIVYADGVTDEIPEMPCLCPPAELALRSYAAGHDLPPMTAEQRAWCLDEIGMVEGYSTADHVFESDAIIAKTVMAAMFDYCRDKELL
jgi:hypothetical protein